MRATLQCVRNQREDQIHIYFFLPSLFHHPYQTHCTVIPAQSFIQLPAGSWPFLKLSRIAWTFLKKSRSFRCVVCFLWEKNTGRDKSHNLKDYKNAFPYTLNKVYEHVSFEVKQKWKTKKDTASFYLSHLSCLFSIYYFSGIVIGIPIRPRQLQIFQREGENLLLFSC